MLKAIYIILVLVGGLSLSLITGCGSPLAISPWTPSTPTPVAPTPTPITAATNIPTVPPTAIPSPVASVGTMTPTPSLPTPTPIDTPVPLAVITSAYASSYCYNENPFTIYVQGNNFANVTDVTLRGSPTSFSMPSADLISIPGLVIGNIIPTELYPITLTTASGSTSVTLTLYHCTPVPMNTNTPTNTPTNSPTPNPTAASIPTPCQTYTRWGDTGGASANAVTLSSGTIFQSYVISQPCKLLNAVIQCNYASAGASIQMAVYADGGGFPSTPVYTGSIQQAYPWANWLSCPYGGVSVPAGTYWIAVSEITGSVAMQYAASSTALMTALPGILPAIFPTAQASPNPPVAAGQVYMGGYLSTCP